MSCLKEQCDESFTDLSSLFPSPVSTSRCPSNQSTKWMLCDPVGKSLFLSYLFQQDEVHKSVYRKRRQLKLAFDLICENLNGEWVLKFERWKALLQVVCPSYSPGKVSLLWHVLDRDNKDYISKYLF